MVRDMIGNKALNHHFWSMNMKRTGFDLDLYSLSIQIMCGLLKICIT